MISTGTRSHIGFQSFKLDGLAGLLFIVHERRLVISPFSVPREAIRALWQEFNLCADGWGVDPAFFDQLCQAITTSMGTEPDEKAAQALFAAFDTDKVMQETDRSQILV